MLKNLKVGKGLANSEGVEIESKTGEFVFRSPTAKDGYAINQLVSDNPPLDRNSVYCNLMQCLHFANTCVVVTHQDVLVAFMTGYVKPEALDTLFIWQMAVSSSVRGRGLAGRMLEQLVERNPVKFIETTITANNRSSDAVFRRFAKTVGAEIHQQVLFDRDSHFHGEHDSEVLYRIGPMCQSKTA